MLKQIRLKKQIELLRGKVTEKEEQLVGIVTREAEIEAAIEEAGTEEDLDIIDEEAENLVKEKDQIEAEKVALTDEIEKLERELEELTLKEKSAKKPENKERGANNMNKETRSAINAYVKSKGQTREVEGFTSVEGGALIPEELLTAHKAPEDIIDLSRYAKVVKVNSGAGKYPVIKKSGSKMVSVAELEANPELAKPVITPITYSIETYRGYIPVSQEVIDDADYDVSGMIAEEITDQELNTKNASIAAVLKLAEAETAEGIDGLKDILNVKLSKVYSPMAVISASLYNQLDKTKDKNGRYLMQDDITAASGKRLLGKEVVVLDDEIIGTASGDLVGFFGDMREFVTLFDRKRASVKWVDNDVYGQLLAGYVRFDVKETDAAAGFYVTYTPLADPVL